jgi:hypothetical protein
MSVNALRSLLESRWHGSAAHGAAQAARLFTTGIPSLYRALGAGFPVGRLTEIFGERSCGKTSLAYGLLARCTRIGDLAAWIDSEKSFFAPTAESAGILLEQLLVIRPRDAAGYRRAADAVVRSGACAIVVLDGACSEALQTHHYARLVAQAEKTGTMLVALSRGTSQPLASFASLRIRASGLSPFWQTGIRTAYDHRLAGYQIACEVVKSKVSVPGTSAAVNVMLADVAGSWPASQISQSEENFQYAYAL